MTNATLHASATALVLALSAACQEPPEADPAAPHTPSDHAFGSTQEPKDLQSYRTSEVVIDERACGLVLGQSNPLDVLALFGNVFGNPITHGSAGDIVNLIYRRDDPISLIPDIVFFVFRRHGPDVPQHLLQGAIRITGSGPLTFSCMRDVEGNPGAPLCPIFERTRN
jgi:hypothetical protein